MATRGVAVGFLVMVVWILLCVFIHETHAQCKTFPVTSVPTLSPNKNATKIIKIGGIGSFFNPTAVALMRFAIYLLNQRTDILPDAILELHHAALANSASNALLASQTLINNFNVTTLIGGVYSSETRIIQLVSRVYEVPQIAASPLSTLLSDKVEYPFLARVIPPDTYQAAAIINLCKRFNWKQAMVIYGDDDLGTYGFDNVNTGLKALNTTVYSYQLAGSTTNFKPAVEYIRNTVVNYNVRIFILYTLATATGNLMRLLNQSGLVGPDFVYICTFGITNSMLNAPTLYPDNAWAIGAVGLMSGGVSGVYGAQIQALWNTPEMVTLFPGATRPDPASGWCQFDAIYTVAYAYDKLRQKGFDYDRINGSTLLAEILRSNFTGATGQVYFDSRSDRKGDYSWYNIQENRTLATTPVAIYSGTMGTTTVLSKFVFYGGVTNPSDGLCRCVHGVCKQGICTCYSGYKGDACDEVSSDGLSTMGLVLVVVLPIVVVGLIFGAAVQFIRVKRSKMIKDMSDKQRSVIKRGDITLLDRIGRGASGEVFKGMFRGTEVAVKRLVTNSTNKEALQEFELECAIMAALRHPNIVLFMGNCYVPETKEVLLVMELMERGSLHDVIHNPKIYLSRELSLNIAYQAAKGMNFLHQSCPPIIHRDLKSHNILMDDKWNARISDFGITRIKELKETKRGTASNPNTQNSLGTIYWTAPEVFEGKSHTEASDCYSFGIVLWEIFTRKTPYDGKEPMLVAMGVTNNMRPEIDESMNPDVRELITRCWAAKPEDRPTFEQIMEKTRSLMGIVGAGSFGGALEDGGNIGPAAPTGTVIFVCTEIENAVDMWDEIPMAMLDAVEAHNNELRENLKKYGGYEIEFKSNSFFVAFGNLVNAMNWCISSQTSLLQIKWTQELLAYAGCESIKNGSGHVIWNGLRVRMAVHVGVPNCEIDRSTGRMTYFGTVVNRTRKLLSASQHKASILASSAIIEQVNTKTVKFLEDISYDNCGEMMDTFRTQSESIYKVLPSSLFGRQNSSEILESLTPGMPNAVLLGEVESDVENTLILSSPSTKKHPACIIPYDEVEEKETVARGAIGDFHKTIWKGRQVTMKVLINQKLEEQDILNLQARSSILRKLKHPNLLEFFGVCLDLGHYALLVGYAPNSGLPALLQDSSVSMDNKFKVRIARQIAEGMDYLASNEHRWIAIHSTLKSANVLVMRDTMEVKVCDFGQSNLKDLARTMTSVGTVAWTAPELLNGEEAHPKISVYSFGIILWEIYTRKIPYTEQHPIRVVAKILGGYRPPIPSDCPPLYTKLMEQCWNADVSERPTWRDILNSLDDMN